VSPPRNFYDVLVLGDEPAGLITGALLARKGYRVAILLAKEGEVALAARPPLLIPGGRTSLVLGWVFQQLGLVQEMRNRLEPLEPACQVLLPRHRLDLGGAAVDTPAELCREFQGDRALIERWLSELAAARERSDKLLDPPPILPPSSIKDQRAWRARERAREGDSGPGDEEDVVKQVPDGHPLRSVASAPIRFLSRLSPPLRPGPGPVRLLSLLSDGVWVAKGGHAGFQATLLERLTTYGAAIRWDGPARQLEPSWRGDVVVETEKEPIGCRVVIVADDARVLPPLLPDGGKRRKLEASLDATREVARRRVLHIVLRREGLPGGLGPLAAVESDDADGSVLIRVNGERLEGVGEDEVVLTVVYDEPINPDPDRPPSAGRAVQLLRGVVPFLDEHVVRLPDWDGGGAGQPIYAAPAASGYAGLSLLPHRTPYKRLFLANHQILPGLGLEGEFLAGAGCAELVARQVKRKDLLKP
jgi:hypothetical protein